MKGCLHDLFTLALTSSVITERATVHREEKKKKKQAGFHL